MKEIIGYKLYAADENGNVFSLNYKRTGLIKIIKPSASKDDYLQSMFKRDDGKYCTRKIHYMVTLAFLGERPEGSEVNHKNGNKLDNRILNLEYITHSENCQHSFDNGLQKPKRGELNGMAKLTRDQVVAIRKQAFDGGRFWGRNKLAKELNISPKHLQNIVNDQSLWMELK